MVKGELGSGVFLIFSSKIFETPFNLQIISIVIAKMKALRARVTKKHVFIYFL